MKSAVRSHLTRIATLALSTLLLSAGTPNDTPPPPDADAREPEVHGTGRRPASGRVTLGGSQDQAAFESWARIGR